ncbi:hypothetical protein FRB93_014102 [Tulasnella sp. JGI-2019a]|nr:hypothetical protein FRB93_014102 [Tulasnella sp. JGI-2019a]
MANKPRESLSLAQVSSLVRLTHPPSPHYQSHLSSSSKPSYPPSSKLAELATSALNLSPQEVQSDFDGDSGNGLDDLDVLTRSDSHAQSEMSAKAFKDVLSEKPIGRDVLAALKLIELYGSKRVSR